MLRRIKPLSSHNSGEVSTAASSRYLRDKGLPTLMNASIMPSRGIFSPSLRFLPFPLQQQRTIIHPRAALDSDAKLM